MSKIFVPADRIGLLSFQDSISTMISTIYRMVENNFEVTWHYYGINFEKTSMWPEGHLYQCGYSLEDTAQARDYLEQFKIKFDIVQDINKTGIILKCGKIAVYDGRGAGAEFSGPLVEVLQMAGFTFEYISD